MALNIGVIGAGRIGKVHAETLVQRVPSATVAAVADVIPAAAQDLAARLHIPKATADYKEILADKSGPGLCRPYRLLSPRFTHRSVCNRPTNSSCARRGGLR